MDPQEKTTPSRTTTPLTSQKLIKFVPFALIATIVAVGIFTGLVMSSRSKNSQITKAAINEEELTGEQKKSFNQTFRDEAEGVVEPNNELDKYAQGTHKLIRASGESQTA